MDCLGGRGGDTPKVADLHSYPNPPDFYPLTGRLAVVGCFVSAHILSFPVIDP